MPPISEGSWTQSIGLDGAPPEEGPDETFFNAVSPAYFATVGTPVVGATRLSYVPWVEQALKPYGATRLPVGTTQGLWDALHRARLVAALRPPVDLV